VRPERALDERLLEEHAVGAEWRDLLDEPYQWGLIDQPRPNTSLHHNPALHYRSLWPLAEFCLPASGDADVELELTARLPAVAGARGGAVSLQVNGEQAAGLPLSQAWSRHAVVIPAARLRRGVNRIALRWPELPAEGDAALAAIRRRLDERLAVELHPVFGELTRLRARTRP
jgi:hypothetical protein